MRCYKDNIIDQLQSPKIMIIEDDELISEILKEFIELQGFSVEAFTNGRLAINRLKQGHDFCFIFLDMQMPVMDGREFMKEFKKLPSSGEPPPVYLLSAEEKPNLYKELGCIGFARKPVELLVIAAIIEPYKTR